MTRFAHQGLSFEPPEDWVNATVVLFHAPPPLPGQAPPPTIAMVRESSPPNETLDTFATRKLMRLASSLADFEIVHTDETVVGGRAAIVRRFRFKAASGAVVEQAMAMIAPGSEDPREVTIIESACAPAIAKAADERFREVLANVRFDPPAEGAAQGAPVPAPARSSPGPGSGRGADAALPESPRPGPRPR